MRHHTSDEKSEEHTGRPRSSPRWAGEPCEALSLAALPWSPSKSHTCRPPPMQWPMMIQAAYAASSLTIRLELDVEGLLPAARLLLHVEESRLRLLGQRHQHRTAIPHGRAMHSPCFHLTVGSAPSPRPQVPLRRNRRLKRRPQVPLRCIFRVYLSK